LKFSGAWGGPRQGPRESQIVELEQQRVGEPRSPFADETATAVYRPCFRAFLLPFGAPGDSPRCNPAPAVPYRWQLARFAASGPRSATGTEVHGSSCRSCSAHQKSPAEAGLKFAMNGGASLPQRGNPVRSFVGRRGRDGDVDLRMPDERIARGGRDCGAGVRGYRRLDETDGSMTVAGASVTAAGGALAGAAAAARAKTAG
jgi:hypothetical protein